MQNKRVWILSVVALLLIAAIIALVLFGRKSNKKAEPKEKQNVSSSAAVYIDDPENSNSESTDSGDKITDDGTGLTLSEPDVTMPDNRTGEKAEKPAQAKQPVNSSDVVSAATPTDKKYVQDANPETGISWDGKTAILYRYADGSESTEKRYGGYYELRPNVWVLYEKPLEKEEENNICSHCGKTMGDGTNGTCVRWMMGDQICPNCGALVLSGSCHTCGE